MRCKKKCEFSFGMECLMPLKVWLNKLSMKNTMPLLPQSALKHTNGQKNLIYRMKAKIVNSVDDVCNFFQQVWGLSKNQTILLKANVQKLVLDSAATAEADLAKARDELSKNVALMASIETLLRTTANRVIDHGGGDLGVNGHVTYGENCDVYLAHKQVSAALTTARNYLKGK